MQGEKISFYRNFFSNTSYKLNLTTNEAYSHRNFFSSVYSTLEITTTMILTESHSTKENTTP